MWEAGGHHAVPTPTAPTTEALGGRALPPRLSYALHIQDGFEETIEGFYFPPPLLTTSFDFEFFPRCNDAAIPAQKKNSVC